MQSFQIGPNEAGQRFDKFLKKYLPAASDSFLYKMLRKKNITLNNKKAEGKESLTQGDMVCFYFSEETFFKFSGKGLPIKGNTAPETAFAPKIISDDYRKAFQRLNGITVLYEDDHVIMLNKPAGILTQKASDQDLSLNEWLIGYLLNKGSVTPESLHTFKPSVCNRLDRNTSGLVLCGRSLPGSQELSRLIRERKIRKYYRVFVMGCLAKDTAAIHITGYLNKNSRTNKVAISPKPFSQESSYIETAYYPLAAYKDRTYVEVELITGKTHQIRAHLASISHPLLGDYKYGNRKWNDRYKESDGIEHQILHAYRMEFPLLTGVLGPLSGGIFIAPLPDIYGVLEQH